MNLEVLSNPEIKDKQFEKDLEDLIRQVGKDWVGFRQTPTGGVYPFYASPEQAQQIDSFLVANGFTGDDNEDVFPNPNQYRKFLIEKSPYKQDSEDVYMYRVGIKKTK